MAWVAKCESAKCKMRVLTKVAPPPPPNLKGKASRHVGADEAWAYCTDISLFADFPAVFEPTQRATIAFNQSGFRLPPERLSQFVLDWLNRAGFL